MKYEELIYSSKIVKFEFELCAFQFIRIVPSSVRIGKSIQELLFCMVSSSVESYRLVQKLVFFSDAWIINNKRNVFDQNEGFRVSFPIICSHHAKYRTDLMRSYRHGSERIFLRIPKKVKICMAFVIMTIIQAYFNDLWQRVISNFVVKYLTLTLFYYLFFYY